MTKGNRTEIFHKHYLRLEQQLFRQEELLVTKQAPEVTWHHSYHIATAAKKTKLLYAQPNQKHSNVARLLNPVFPDPAHLCFAEDYIGIGCRAFIYVWLSDDKEDILGFPDSDSGYACDLTKAKLGHCLRKQKRGQRREFYVTEHLRQPKALQELRTYNSRLENCQSTAYVFLS